MKKSNNIVTQTVIFFLMPIILLLALYVQIHGDYSPGGGFQAGAVFASILIVHSMVTGNFFPTLYIKILSVTGVGLYAGTGCFAMTKGENFLNYSALLTNNVSGQSLGVMLVELGVGITVFSSMLLIYNSFYSK
ncbi:MAG: Na(+)/H(+) antiporter subunit B [Rickettsiaceae bacterium H1]|nr:Na(+)/H(+) antiporter subunit B [Rickettsiaceae bacterium H1]